MFISNSFTTTIKASTYFGLPKFTQGSSAHADDIVINAGDNEFISLSIVSSRTGDGSSRGSSNGGRRGFRDDRNVGELTVVCAP